MTPVMEEVLSPLMLIALYSPQAQATGPATPTPGMRTLYQNMQLLKLDVAQHVPIHGRVATNDEFVKQVGGKTLSSEK